MEVKKEVIVGIIPLFNPTEIEIKNIQSYVNTLDYCFLLDDSGYSNINLCKKLMLLYPKKVEYICNKTNVGLCATVNKGFHLAISKGANWVLIMNPDGTFKNDAISIYRKFIRNNGTEKIGIIAPVFNIDRRPKEAKLGCRAVKYPDMSGCLYNCNILKELGFYDINTYFYSLDVEYCIRVRKSGYQIIECSEAVLNHKPGETYEIKIFGKSIFKCGKDKPQRYYYQIRSGCYVHKKYHDSYNLFMTIYKILKVIFLFNNKLEYFRMILWAYKDAKRGYYGKISER